MDISESKVKVTAEKSSYSTKTFKYSLNSKHSSASKHVTSSSTKKDLSYDNSKWLKQALPTKLGAQIFTSSDYEEESTSINEKDFTHTGFIQYLAIAWADEKGIVLRPDMFHHLICCEIAKDVIANPETYRSLYTNSKEKKEIEIVAGCDNEFIRLLDLALSNEIPHKEFKSQMTDVKFISQPESYEIVKRICFANSATPFYNYMRSKCGFPSIIIPDVLQDWINLYDFIRKMADIIGTECKYVPRNSWDHEKELSIVKCLRKSSVNIKEIIDNFNNQTFLEEKFQSIFYVEDDHRCGSGHDFPYNIYGWIKDFYLKSSPLLKDYPTHLPYLPYKFIGVGNFSIVSGIISSKLQDDILEPKYGNIVLRITNEQLFDVIKN